MRVAEIIVDLHVSDIEAARVFYTDYLDLTGEEFNLGGWRARPPRHSGINIQLMTRDVTVRIIWLTLFAVSGTGFDRSFDQSNHGHALTCTNAG